MTLQERIKSLRIERGWTQEQLAAEMGTKQSRVSAVEDAEKGENPEFATIRAAARAFGLSVSDFLKGVDEPVEESIP